MICIPFLLSVLYMYPQGKLLYCHAPPGVDPRQFNGFQRTYDGEGDTAEGGESGVQGARGSTAAGKVSLKLVTY